jgi:hypothetical protein
MINKLFTALKTGSFLAVLSVIAFSCIKDDKMVIPPQKAFFTPAQLTATYSLTGPTVVYKIPVALTQPVETGKTKTVSISSSSTTGAVVGTHYNFTNTLSFAPGKIVDTIIVTGVYNQYLTGRKDVIKFTFSNPEDGSVSLNNAFTLNVTGPCFEGDLVLSDFLGAYNNSNEVFGSAYGPYQTTISAVNLTSATTGTIVVTNVYDAGWNPITFNLDWTNPADRRATLVQQSGIGDAGTVNSAYAGSDVSVRPFAGETGTFSWCNKTLTLKMQVGVTNLGWFGTLYTLNMAR